MVSGFEYVFEEVEVGTGTSFLVQYAKNMTETTNNKALNIIQLWP